MHDVYKNIGEYNPDIDNKTLIVFDDLIADMINNKKLDSKVTDCLLEVENETFLLFLLLKHILRFQKIID